MNITLTIVHPGHPKIDDEQKFIDALQTSGHWCFKIKRILLTKMTLDQGLICIGQSSDQYVLSSHVDHWPPVSLSSRIKAIIACNGRLIGNLGSLIHNKVRPLVTINDHIRQLCAVFVLSCDAYQLITCEKTNTSVNLLLKTIINKKNR